MLAAVAGRSGAVTMDLAAYPDKVYAGAPLADPALFHDTTPPDLPNLYERNLAWGDYDNDGLLDFVLTDANYTPTSPIYRQDHDGACHEVHETTRTGACSGLY